MTGNRIITLQAVVNLMNEGGYGTYKLFSLVGGELLGGTHLTTDGTAPQSMKVTEVIVHLENLIENLGFGQYRIQLRKSIKTPDSSNVVTFRFQVMDQEAAGNRVATETDGRGLGNMSLGEFQDAVSKSVEDRIIGEREKLEKEKRIWELEQQMKNLRADQRRSQQMPEWANGLVDVVKMVGGAVLVKVAPESVPMVNQMLGVGEAAPKAGENGKAEGEKVENFERTD